MSKTTYFSDAVLNVLRNTTFTGIANLYAGLLSAVTNQEAGTVTEAAYAGYARQVVAMGAPAGGGGGRQIQNTGVPVFPAIVGGPLTWIAVGFYDALTVGNLLEVVFVSSIGPMMGVADAANGITNDLISSPLHGLTTDQKVRIEAFPGGATIPAGIAEDTEYFVLAAGLTTEVFKISTSSGGAAVNITAEGKCLVVPYTPLVTQTGDQPTYAASQLTIVED